MNRTTKLGLAVVAAAAAVGAGGAFAASKLTADDRSQAIIDDAAGRLGVQPSALSDALKKAIEKQIDADVAAGRLSKDQGDALKKRVEAGEVPLVGGGYGFPHRFEFGFGLGGHGILAAGLAEAATYLGITVDQLRTQLQSGKTLAQVAKDNGKTVDGLVTALTDAASKKLDALVADGHLTRAQADEIESDLKQDITDIVNGTFRRQNGLPRMFHGPRFFRGAPPLNPQQTPTTPGNATA
jgi:hypothetical protein